MDPTAPKKHYSNKYKAWLTEVSANLLENRLLDIIANGNPNVPTEGGRIQESDEQLVASNKGKALEQGNTSFPGQVPRQVAQKRRDEPTRPRNSDEDAPTDEDRHWKRPKGRPLTKGPVEPHISDDAQSSNHNSSVSARQNSRGSNSTNPPNFPEAVSQQARLPPNASHQEAQPAQSQDSIYPATDSFISRYKAFIAVLWSESCEKLRTAPAEEITSFKDSVEKQLRLMRHDGVDLSVLEQRVAEFFKKAQDYDQVRSSVSDAMPVETQVEELWVARAALREAKAEYSKTNMHLLDQQKLLEDSNERKTVLENAIKEAEKAIQEAEKVIHDSKEELTRIHTQEPGLEADVAKAQEEHDATQAAVTTAEKEISRIENCPMLSTDDEEKLASAKKELEAYKEDLLNFQLL